MPISSTLLIRLLIFQVFIISSLHAQHPKDFSLKNVFSNHAINQQLDESFLPESNCSNGLDDNGDGLADSNDSHCYFYFDSINYQDCQPTPILWACSSLGIHWINLATNEDRLVCPAPDNDFFVDIAWVPNGKLYAAGDSRKIYEIDPLTCSLTPIDFVNGYQPNGMTADASGMLYLTAYTDPQTCYLLKFDPVTHQAEIILRLSDYDLLASGDCCFLNGFLYVSCNGYIARVDIIAKTVQKLKVNNADIDDSWALTTLGDGYLYVSDNAKGIYRLDQATMEGTLVSTFNQSAMLTSGFSSYVEACHAPCTKPMLSLGPDTVVCTNSMLLLNPEVDRTVSSFLWNNGTTQKTSTITSPGTYWVEVGNKCASNSDTIVVGSAEQPLVALPNDTVICNLSSIVLHNLQSAQARDQFLWSDLSDQSTLSVTAPGTYWLQMSNVCGNAADTVQIFPKIDNCECFLNIPNAFSPNDDRVNDLFQLSSNCIVKGGVQVFNRWGQSVYKSENLEAGWNGLYAGKVQPPGIYVYTLRFSYLNHPGIFTRKGAVTLVR